MRDLIELYEMISLNEATLRGSERMALLKARLALSIFERAMERLRQDSTEATGSGEASLAMAA